MLLEEVVARAAHVAVAGVHRIDGDAVAADVLRAVLNVAASLGILISKFRAITAYQNTNLNAHLEIVVEMTELLKSVASLQRKVSALGGLLYGICIEQNGLK